MSFDWLHDYIVNIISQVIITVGIFLWLWLTKRVIIFSQVYRLILAKIARKKYVLIWNDHDIKNSNGIIKLLEKKNSKFRYFALNQPKDIFKFPLKPGAIQAIIFIVSDVTKLSEDPKERNSIQDKVLKYVEKGGTLIGTHDIIYRRVRNDLFEMAFGCRITNFQRENKPIEYMVTPENTGHPVLKDLPDTFCLEDGEVCWGEWTHDVLVLLKSRKAYNGKKPIPLLTFRSY